MPAIDRLNKLLATISTQAARPGTGFGGIAGTTPPGFWTALCCPTSSTSLKRYSTNHAKPATELEYTSVSSCCAVLLSAQATDVGVNKGHAQAVCGGQHAPGHPHLGLQGLESFIKTIGLYRSKARHLMQTCPHPG